jgi:5-methylcytosine-specific restriction endonuclease McrA
MTGKRFKLDHCERCGFIPEDLVQLDIDHINGDRTNNDSSNLQTLCANCHRLKTKAFDDWNKRREEV